VGAARQEVAGAGEAAGAALVLSQPLLGLLPLPPFRRTLRLPRLLLQLRQRQQPQQRRLPPQTPGQPRPRHQRLTAQLRKSKRPLKSWPGN